MIKRLLIALSIGTFFGANQVHAESVWGPAPKVRGDYLVCPDGGALRLIDLSAHTLRGSRKYLDAARYASESIVRSQFRDQNAFIDIRFLPGKKSRGSYSDKEYNALIKHLKWNNVATPDSFVGIASGWFEPHSKVILENSNQEKITLLLTPRRASARSSIITKNGEHELQRYDLDYDYSPTSIISCPPESSLFPGSPTEGKKYMLMRMIVPMSFKKINKYGEKSYSAMHVLIVNAWVEKVYL